MIDSDVVAQTLSGLRAWDETIEQIRARLPRSEANQAIPEADLSSASRGVTVRVDGAGYLVLRQGGRTYYTRSANLHVSARGDLTDDAGRMVMLAADRAATKKAALTSAEAARVLRYDVGADGTLSLKLRPGPGHSSAEQRIVGRLCIAIFNAPDQLRGQPGGVWSATRGSGPPRLLAAGSVNTGSIARGTSLYDVDAVQAQLHKLWLMGDRTSLQQALVASDDELTRIALGLVR